ncbi:MAG: sigma-54 dependent transcriptional regulator, partial [Candidatus Saganbacteria bacterium]|nr:sigma-54 dependent transcriptional regulator [Candidatus Saganbacteria bacterium]
VLTVNTAIEAMKIGAYDYITKPFNIEELRALILKGLEKGALQKENLRLRYEIKESSSFEKIIGKSKKMIEVFELVDEIAKSSATVIIYGESGTGKELVARAIHNRSKRAEKLFVPVNCAAIPENLLESELFGHEKGAFTGALERHLGKFEIAHGGTLFLDEISSLPLPMQAKLLRVLQEKVIERIGGEKPIPIDARIISATNSYLNDAVKSKKFREDLYYRLNVVPVELPPLRERSEDIPLLIEHFIVKFNLAFGKKVKCFTKEAMVMIENYNWPGNVRELENLIERLVVLSKEKFIGLEKLPAEISGTKIQPYYHDLSLRRAVRSFEIDFIKKAVERADGSKSKAAKNLGIHRNTLLKLSKNGKNRISAHN